MEELKNAYVSQLLSQTVYFSQLLSYLRYRDCIRICNINKHFRTLALENYNIKEIILRQLVIDNFHTSLQNNLQNCSLDLFKEVFKNGAIYYELTGRYKTQTLKKIEIEPFQKILSKGIDENWCYTFRTCAKNFTVGDLLKRSETGYERETVNPKHIHYMKFKIKNKHIDLSHDKSVKYQMENQIERFPFMDFLYKKE
jgi:hypothetical protein